MAFIDLVIDSDGDMFAAGSAALANRHIGSQTLSDLPHYLVRNLGFIRVRTISDDGLAISLRPALVSDAAVTEAIDTLLQNMPSYFVIHIVGAEAALIRLDDIDDVVAVLAYRTATVLKRASYFSQPMSLLRLKTDERLAELAGMYRRWQRSHGNLEVSRAAGLGFRGGGNRRYLARLSGDVPVFQKIGDGYTAVGNMVSEAESHLVHDQPDPKYGARVATALEEAHSSESIRLEIIESDVQYPDGRLVRPRYVRLLLPWRCSGEILISSAAVPRVVL